MKRWPTKSLGELCDVRIGRTPRRDQPRFWGGDAVWVTVGELNGGTITSSKERISDVAVRECMPEPVPAGTLLFSFKLSIGKMAVAGCPLYTNEAIAALPIHNPKELSRDFLRYALMSESREGGADTAVLGKLLNKEKVRQLSIPVPPLADQKWIVNLLDEADELRKLRAQADRRTTDLIPAFFHEMFGKRATKKFHWPKKPLGDLTTRITKGESPGWQGFQYTNEGPLFITSENVLWGSLDVTEPKRIPLAFHQKLTRSAIQPDDVLLNLVGASIGRCCLVPKGLGAANINQAVAVISCGKQLLPVFLTHMLLSSDAQTYFHGGKVEAARANISLGDIRHFETAVPPIELQHEFVAHVAEIRGLETEQAASFSRSDDLFQSLLHRAFQGEL